MILVEKHNINKNHRFRSKNLYNQALYNVRQFYFENKQYLPYYKNYHITKSQESYDCFLKGNSKEIYDIFSVVR